MDHSENQSQPPSPAGGLTGTTRFMITAAAFVIVIAGMKAAVQIVVPFLMAVFLAIISTPALFWLKKKGVNTPVAIILVSLVILLAGLLFGTVLTTSIADFTQDLPQYTQKLDEKLRNLEQQWNTWVEEQRIRFQQEHGTAPEPENAVQAQADDMIQPEAQTVNADRNAPENALPETQTTEQKEPFSITRLLDARAGVQLMADLLSQLGSIMADSFLIYLTMVFILLEASILPGKIQAAMKSSPETFENLTSIAGDVKKYLAVKTAISLATGLLIAVWLTILGVKYPIVWGLIAFLLNFVPNIGSIIAAIPACALAFLQLGAGSAALAGMGYLVVNIVIGNFIEPRIMGQRLGLSTLVVFLSLIFWGWVLGPMGMLLSIPLTMTVKIILQSYPETRTFAILLGSQNPPPQMDKSRRHKSEG